jgi:hypothetical protein
MDSNTAAEAFQSTNNEIRNISIQLKLANCWTDRKLRILFTAGDDNLANVLSAADIRQSGNHLVEAVLADGMDRSDVASLDQVKNLLE